MLRLFLIAVLISNITTKLLYSHTIEENYIQPKNEVANDIVEFVNRGNPLWVLSLSGVDWMAPKLRLGNTEELKEFFYNIVPSIRNSRRRRPPVRVKKDDPERPLNDDPSRRSMTDLKKDFMTMINKFALSSSIDPDAYITDNTHAHDNSPSIAVYFKGPYTVLIVEIGEKQWHYVINTLYSLPDWFHETHHPRESPILIPEDIKIKLYGSLWRLLHVLFGFPV